jgi:hypothetical protein
MVKARQSGHGETKTINKPRNLKESYGATFSRDSLELKHAGTFKVTRHGNANSETEKGKFLRAEFHALPNKPLLF